MAWLDVAQQMLAGGVSFDIWMRWLAIPFNGEIGRSEIPFPYKRGGFFLGCNPPFGGSHIGLPESNNISGTTPLGK